MLWSASTNIIQLNCIFEIYLSKTSFNLVLINVLDIMREFS